MKILLLFLCAVVLAAAYNVEDSAVERESSEVEIPEKRVRRPKCPIIDFKCGKIGGKTMPHVCQNMINAINNGHPTTLHRTTKSQTDKNRRASGCPKKTAMLRKKIKKMKKKKVSKTKLSCDEYPFASSQEGGAGAETMMVPAKENSRQGGLLASFYRKNKIVVGGCYEVEV